VSRSIGQALGFVPLDSNTAVATISFNKAFSFDFNPDNGINSTSLDFVGTATHEIGHALGFISNAGGGSGVPVTTLGSVSLSFGYDAEHFCNCATHHDDGWDAGLLHDAKFFPQWR
jgi:hypothetical protein